MNTYFITVMLSLILVAQSSFALVDDEVEPFYLISNDYGILTTSKPSTPIKRLNISHAELKSVPGEILWQCFPRDLVSVSVSDAGYSSADFAWEQNHSNLIISIYEGTKVKHEYTMRRFWPLSASLYRFKTWLRLMKDEKYVCLAGGFIDRVRVTSKIENRVVIYWIFDALKSKKGCDSYLSGFCDRT